MCRNNKFYRKGESVVRKLKKTVITFGIVTMFLMTVLTTSVSAANFFKVVYNLTSMVQKAGTYSTLTSYSNTCILDVTNSNYSDSWKYVSCSSYTYNGSNGHFLDQDRVTRSTDDENYPGNSISTASTRLLNVNSSTVKSIFYGELYNTSENTSGKKERIWITRYKDETFE